MTNVVTRRERAAALLRRDLDRRANRETDPRVDAIANATVRPATVNGSASVGVPVVSGGSDVEARIARERATVDDGTVVVTYLEPPYDDDDGVNLPGETEESGVSRHKRP